MAEIDDKMCEREKFNDDKNEFNQGIWLEPIDIIFFENINILQ